MLKKEKGEVVLFCSMAIQQSNYVRENPIE
jgi:hypothetical protein